MNCLYCDTPLNGKRKGAKFCSARCRVAHNRNTKSVTDNHDNRNTKSVTDNHDNRNTKSVTDNAGPKFEDYELIKITADAGTPNAQTLKIIAPKPERPAIITLSAWFDHRPGRASLGRDYADLIKGLARYDRDTLIQEIIAYRADLDDLRAAKQA